MFLPLMQLASVFIWESGETRRMTNIPLQHLFLASLRGENSHPQVSGNGIWAVGLGNQGFGWFFLTCQRLTPFCLSPLPPWITDNIMLLIILAFSWLLFQLSTSWPPQLNLAALAINHRFKKRINWIENNHQHWSVKTDYDSDSWFSHIFLSYFWQILFQKRISRFLQFLEHLQREK